MFTFVEGTEIMSTEIMREIFQDISCWHWFPLTSKIIGSLFIGNKFYFA